MIEDKTFETAEAPERVILVGIDDGSGDAEDSIAELAALAETAGAVVVDSIIQKRESPHPSHYLGKGRLMELKELIAETNAETVITDDELSPAQMRNMSDELDIKVIDRSLLILDIFAARASSAEGAIQTELARLKYELSHLSGLGKSLSRQGGGGAGGGGARRGLGETRLELDRRRIRERISHLKKQIEEIRKHRDVSRDRREKRDVYLAALCGYTNSGKSTLFNALSDANALAFDKLFATLDTTVRSLKLPSGGKFLIADTVGFIRKLPHNLIDAFSATLEELRQADVLLHVVDASASDRLMRMEVVANTLAELKTTAPVVAVFNKIDKEEVARPLPFSKGACAHVEISAKTGQGLDALLFIIEETLLSSREPSSVLIPYNEVGAISIVRSRCNILSEKFLEEGVFFKIYAEQEIIAKLMRFVVTDAVID